MIFFLGKIGNDDKYDEEEDILFDYNRYNISSIRKEVLNNLLKKMIWILELIYKRIIIIQRIMFIIKVFY